ncbi:hypothetical protein GGR57DRAFT_263567 [Xylariaceae sp. FL1272]|nr:hypothetical protein GGR57DRAFT_263567 [Xylariaceae sp. FL1272]
MRSVSGYLTLLLLPSLSQAANHFISPKYQSSSKGGKYGSDDVWSLGSSQLVGFVSTFDAYKIELWQQQFAGSAALADTLVYTQKKGEDKPQSFYWTVQTYELQLSDSPVFFFWLKDLNSSAQQTSAYFNITVDNGSDPSSSATSKTAITSSTALTTSTIRTLSSSISTTTPQSPTVSTTDSAPNPSITSASDSTNTTTSSKGLSPSAAAGIAVGVSLGAISLLGLAAFAIWKRRRQRKQQTQQQAELQGSDAHMSHSGSGSTRKPTPMTEYGESPVLAVHRTYYQPQPVEPRSRPAELAARPPEMG